MCKHRQTGSSHCSSFVYTLTFSQHLSYVFYTFGKRGPFSNWGPYCSFCYKFPVWMPKQTHTHTPTHSLVLHTLCGHSFVLVYLRKLNSLNHCHFHWRLFWGQISSQSFLLIFSSILRQITPNPNAYFLRKLRISNSWKHCVDIVLRSTLRMLHRNTHAAQAQSKQTFISQINHIFISHHYIIIHLIWLLVWCGGSL